MGEMSKMIETGMWMMTGGGGEEEIEEEEVGPSPEEIAREARLKALSQERQRGVSSNTGSINRGQILSQGSSSGNNQLLVGR